MLIVPPITTLDDGLLDDLARLAELMDEDGAPAAGRVCYDQERGMVHRTDANGEWTEHYTFAEWDEIVEATR
jgi:hypothetical protein